MAAARRDDGFTLIELLVSVLILAVLVGTLATALIVSFRTTGEATDRMARSHDVLISTAAFASDVQSADSVLATDWSTPCGTTGAELTLVWMDDTTRHVASYFVETSSGEQRLVRRHCVASGAADVSTISHFVGTAAAPQCDAAACTGTVAAPQTPREVAWTITDVDGASHTLRGTRRVA